MLRRAFPGATKAPPTFGGRQVWTDRRLRHGYRVQVHAWLRGVHRLLDPEDRLLAVGTDTAVLGAFERVAPTADRIGPPCVVAFHGLGRSRGSFAALAQRLASVELVGLDYASAWASPAEHGRLLAEALAALEPRARIDLVAFSMGALVARYALDRLARMAPERLASVGRLVMIAPPNRGAALADALHRLAPFGLAPPVVRGLSALGAGAVPPPRVPTVVIAGDGGPRFRGWWSEPNDGLIRVSDTFVAEMDAHFLVSGAAHFFMLNQPQVLDLAAGLLAGDRSPAARRASIRRRSRKRM